MIESFWKLSLPEMSDVPPPDQNVNILGDVWSILVLANYSTDQDRSHCVSSVVLSVSDICGDLPPEVDGTECDLNTRKERSLLVTREKPWRCLQILLKPSESKRCSLRLLSMYLLPLTDLWRLCLVVWEKAWHGDVSRFSWRFPDKDNKGVYSLVCANVFPAFFDILISTRCFFLWENFFFQEFATNTGGIVDICDTLTSEFMFSWMCVRWVGW